MRGERLVHVDEIDLGERETGAIERGFCPSCFGRRMCATAANLVEHVLPGVALRQWVLTFPFAWRRRLAQDGALLGALPRPSPKADAVADTR